MFSFFNTFGFLSADEFYTVDIYLFLSLIFFLLFIYWIYKIISNQISINFFSKLMTITLPILILEKMMSLQIYSEINRSGELNMGFEAIFIICNLMKNILIRIILFSFALGYKILVPTCNFVSKKKIMNFCIIMLGYISSLIIYSILYSRYLFQ